MLGLFAAALSIFVSVWLFGLAFRLRTRSATAVAFCIRLVAEACWTLGFLAERFAPTMQSKIFWDHAQLAVMPMVSFAGTLIALTFADLPARRAWRDALLVALPEVPAVLWLIFAPGTREGAYLTADGVLSYPFTTVDSVLFAYVYALVIGAAVYVWRQQDSNPFGRRHARIVSLGLLAPIVVAFPFLLGFRVEGERDTSSFSFLASNALLAWGILRVRMLGVDFVPRTALVDAMPDAVLVLDPSGRVSDSNAPARALLGDALVSGEPPREPLVSWIEQAADKPFEARAPDAEERWLEVVVRPVRDERRLGRLVVLRDVTERHRGERALREAHDGLELRVRARTAELSQANAALLIEVEERRAAEAAARASEAQTRAFFDQSPDRIAVIDPDGRVVMVNRVAAESLPEAARSGLVGAVYWETPWWQRDAGFVTRLRAAIAEAARGGLVRLESRSDGPHLDVLLGPLRDPDGAVRFVLCIARDVSDAVRAQEKRGQLEQQVAQLRKMEALGRLAGGVAHDFNNLLTIIYVNTSIALAEVPPGSPAHDAVREIDEVAKSAASLTRQLLAFTRQVPTTVEDVSVDEVVERLATMLQRLVGDDVTVALSLGPAGLVRIDPRQLEQVIVNLVVNARDAMPSGGRIELVTSDVVGHSAPNAASPPSGMHVRLRVRDDGVGMSEEVRARIFEPFFTTKPVGQGTGLGLATVYAIVQGAGGALEVQSELGKGSTFDVLLPRLEGESRRAAPERGRGAATQPHTQGGVVWVVEDNAAVRGLVVGQLARFGYDVRTFERGDDALSAAATHTGSIDVLVTDVVMPGALSGPELAKRLRVRHAALRVLYVSGYADDRIDPQELAPGRTEFLPKPFSSDELAERVQALARAQAASPPPSVQA